MKNHSAGTGALKREIGLGSALTLVVANMVGTGVFTTSGFIVAELGSAQALLLCWLVGGLFALAGALCYAELGAMMPQAGGEYRYLRRTFGPRPAFLSGGIALIGGFSAPIAAAAIAFATYVPGGGREPWFVLELFGRPTFTFSPATLLAVGVVVVLSLVHYHSVGLGRRVQNLLTVFKIGVILLFAVGGLWLGSGDATRLMGLLTWFPLGAVFSRKFAVALIFVPCLQRLERGGLPRRGDQTPRRNIPLALVADVIVSACTCCSTWSTSSPCPGGHGRRWTSACWPGALFGPGSAGRGMVIAFALLSVISAMIMPAPVTTAWPATVFFRCFASGLRAEHPGQGHSAPRHPGGADDPLGDVRDTAHLHRLHPVPGVHPYGLRARQAAPDGTGRAAPLPHPGLSADAAAVSGGQRLDRGPPLTEQPERVVRRGHYRTRSACYWWLRPVARLFPAREGSPRLGKGPVPGAVMVDSTAEALGRDFRGADGE
jgi:APA family basic amino acid/polyamine antiporter